LLIFECNNKKDITTCISIIKQGAVVVFPTDTVYGIGCDPYNEEAVERIFRIKKRSKTKPFPVLTHNIKSVKKIIKLDKIGSKLAKAFWPGQLTIIGHLIDDNIPKIVNGGKKSLGVRIPNNLCTLELLKGCNFLLGTSANISNTDSNVTAQQILESDLKGYDAILIGDNNILKRNVLSSTIVDITENSLQIIREGPVKSEDIYEIISRPK
jgi:L-threonylcarbamoyladenylate synthase